MLFHDITLICITKFFQNQFIINTPIISLPLCVRYTLVHATMTDLPPYPPLDPTTYDLIVVGTGVPSSILAAAASSSGSSSVLHLDPNLFYGSHFASLSLPDLTSFLNSNSLSPPPHPSNTHDFLLSVDLVNQSLYSSVEISTFEPEPLEQHSRTFNVDLCGPRAVFCADESINLMLKSGSNSYVEFKSVDASFVGDSSGELRGYIQGQGVDSLGEKSANEVLQACSDTLGFFLNRTR